MIKQKVEDLRKAFKEAYGIDVDISIVSFHNDKETANRAHEGIKSEWGTGNFSKDLALDDGVNHSHVIGEHYKGFEYSIFYKEEEANV